jgi:enamine deaminase RidA (YjgF/YER057c/UK114 family)
MNSIDQRLQELRVDLLSAPIPAGNYLPFARSGNLVQLAGIAPAISGAYEVVGKLGRELSLQDGQRAAYLCALNVLATLRVACGGDFSRVRRFLVVRGFVNADPEFRNVRRSSTALRISLSRSSAPKSAATRARL